MEMIYLQVEGNGETDHVDHTERAILRYWWCKQLFRCWQLPWLMLKTSI